jgi:type III restriction enzyme
MSYTPDPETGMLAPEPVDVYGIPFSLIPFKGQDKKDAGSDPTYHHVFPVDERAAFEIRVPTVESYTYDAAGCGISCDVTQLESFVVNEEPTQVYLAPTRGYVDQATVSHPQGDFVHQTREAYYETVRFQQIVFRVAQLIADDLVAPPAAGSADAVKKALLARHQLFPAVVRIVERYIQTKVRFGRDHAGKEIDPRELGLEKYVRLLRERVRDGILAAVPAAETRLLPVINSYRPWASTSDVNYRTTRSVARLTKSHLNFAPLYSDWEQQAIDILEDLDAVECYTPNDRHVGLVIPYEHMEATHYYEPDFIARMRGGRLVVLEIKGKAGELHDENRILAKHQAAKKWVTAVNNAGRYGHWAFEVCRDLARLRDTLELHAELKKVLPFRYVVPKPADRFKTCVPLTTLRAAAGRWSEEQMDLDQFAEWATDWIEFDTKARFEPGMFVAKVQGDSMEPEIPNGSYCLFRRPPAGSRQGRKLLVWHSGISDPQTGGQYTLKVYMSEKTADAGETWRHTRIVLKPLNPAYEPIVLTPADEGEVRMIGEFVEVVR